MTLRVSQRKDKPMSVRWDDDLEKAVEEASRNMKLGMDFYPAVWKAVNEWHISFSIIAKALSERSANKRRNEAEKRKMEPAKPEPKPDTGLLFGPDTMGAIRR
jgi:hypothetical protein